MTSVMRWLVALVAALLSFWNPPTLGASPPAAAAFSTYTYDAPCCDTFENDTAPERGPPVIGHVNTTRDAVAHRSRCASTRPEASPAQSFTVYADSRTSAPITSTTGAHALAADREFSLARRSGVATKTGRRAAPNCLTNSFTGGTLVLMADGSKKPIRDVELGDRVMATDPVTGERGPREVVDLIRHGGLHTMVAVRLSDGTTIDATDRHPFWVESRDAWVDAIDLQPGDVVITADGDRLSVETIGISEQDLTAYNLTVAGLHTYHVSTAEVLVHNCKWPKPTDDNCAACAREIQDMIGGDIVHVRPTGGPRMGPSTNNPAGNWAEHYVVVRDGKVYDGFTGPSGMSIPDYKAQFQYADDINFGF